MKKIRELTKKELKKVQEVELEILKEFDRICKKHNIKYFLAGGTCLGAVRHKGFIPWDDDIDVSMLRADYDKFIKVYKEDLNKEKFYLESPETDDNCGMLYAKLKRKDSIFAEAGKSRNIDEEGIWIDIFPMDNLCDNKFLGKLYLYRTYALKIIMMNKYGYIEYTNNKKRNIIIGCVKFLSLFFNKKRLKKKLCRMTRKFNNRDTNTLLCFAGVYLKKEIFNKEVFKNSIETDFEDLKSYIPVGYDKYLTQFYGDYMKLPPKEKRVGHHEIIKLKFPDEKEF